MKFVVRIFRFVEVVHTYVMSSVSKSLDIKRRKNVVVVHSWEDRSHGSLLKSQTDSLYNHIPVILVQVLHGRTE